MKERKRISKAVEELKEECPNFAKVARTNYLIDTITDLEQELKDIYQSYEEYRKRDLPYWWREAVLRLRGDVGIKKKIRRLKSELYYLWEETKGRSQITREMIDRALEYPIENLVEVNKRGFAHCVAHDDEHPSMYCRNNFAYCFACGHRGDVIDLYMRVHGCNFLQAVKNLE